MTHLPDAIKAYIEEAKIRGYLLKSDHPQNGGKTAFFHAFGFTSEQWTVLRDALMVHAITNDVVDTTHSSHGTKHVVRCSVQTPDGRNPCITTIWIVEGERSPRLVTAYP